MEVHESHALLPWELLLLPRKLSSEVSDGEGVAAPREGDIPAEGGTYSSSSSHAVGV